MDTKLSLENRRRVKLYVLNAARHWDDRGTGHVSAMYTDRFGGWTLIVREEISSAVLLESKIDLETSYQKQQETLIVWSENDSDMALSFQEKSGCEEVWAKICQVQGKDPSVEITQDNFDDDDEEDSGSSLTNYGGEGGINNSAGVPLPICEMGKLDKVVEVMQTYMGHPAQREKLANAIEQEEYIKKLLEVFRKCEDLDHTDGLQQLYIIIKSILMLNRNVLYEVLFSDECIEDVLGCLEWDPLNPQPKSHRKYVREIAKFKEVIPLENPELYQKIQQMYRVQYIQDVILPSPSVFEDNVLNTLHSFVFFNKMEIVNILQEDERFLKELFAQLINPDTPLDKRRDQVLFLREFCQFSQTLQQPQREGFFRMLMSHGVLVAVQGALDVIDAKTRAAVVDVFTYIVELHPFVVREYSMTQAAKETDDNKLFFVHIIQQAVLNDPDPQAAGAMQILTIMRLLLDPENMLSSPNKTEKTEFLTFFYKRCLPYLVEPIKEFTANSVLPKREDLHKVLILNLLLEFFGYCVEHHTFHMKNYLIGHELLKHVMVLMQSAHQFLVVAVVRFVRKIVGLQDPGLRDFYNRCIEKGDHFKPILDVFLKNGRRNNLLNSAVLELFEFIKHEDIKKLIVYTIGKHGERLKNISYTQTFNLLMVRYNCHTSSVPEPSGRSSMSDRPLTPEPEMASVKGRLGVKRFRRDDRDLDEDEEHWFQSDEGDDKEQEAAETNGDDNHSDSFHMKSGLIKALPAVNTAPPVKRPAMEGEDDDDSPFNGSGMRYSGGRAARKITCRSPPASSLKVSLASADSTRHLPSSSNHISSSISSSSSPSSAWDVVTNNNGNNSSSKSNNSHISLNPASPSLVDYPDDEEDAAMRESSQVPTTDVEPPPSIPPGPDRQEIAL